jgi:hypothetical protein
MDVASSKTRFATHGISLSTSIIQLGSVAGTVSTLVRLIEFFRKIVRGAR